MDDGADGPDIVLLRHGWNLGADPLVGPAALGHWIQGREAEIAEDEVGSAIADDAMAEEDIAGLDVAVDDPSPRSRRDVGVFCLAIIAIVKKGYRIRELREAMPQEIFGSTSFAWSRNMFVQVAPLAVFEVQDQGFISGQVAMIEIDDPRVMGQYAFENEHLCRYGAMHEVFSLFFADEGLPVAYPPDEPDLALTAFADLFHLFIGVGSNLVVVLDRRPSYSTFRGNFVAVLYRRPSFSTSLEHD